MLTILEQPDLFNRLFNTDYVHSFHLSPIMLVL